MTELDFEHATAAAGLSRLVAPYVSRQPAPDQPATRILGRTGFEVTTLGLGGQAALQWTPPGENPEYIIVKAISLGINYLDTSNRYGPSQRNYGKAFRSLHLIPGAAGYAEKQRRSLFLASKTRLRYAKGHPGNRGPVANTTNGAPESMAVDDIKRTLSQIFGDGRGSYPPGAYLDLFQIHNIEIPEEVAAIFEGLDKPDPKAEWIGALAALRDYRDGSNLTGLNPKEEKLIRHIGITGHFSSPVLMECLQRDTDNVIDTLLVAVNANDRQYFSHQDNVLPVAAAKNLGVIAMKVFADGAMYGKGNHFSRHAADVVQTVGSPEIPSAALIGYTLSTLGVATAIIGTGHIDHDPRLCQLEQNLAASRLAGLDAGQRRNIEQIAARAKGGRTNYFQQKTEGLSAPQQAAVFQENRGDRRLAHLSWHTAYAAEQPLSHYEIKRDGEIIGRVKHLPQTTLTPVAFEDAPGDHRAHCYRVVTVDTAGRRAASEELLVPATD